LYITYLNFLFYLLLYKVAYSQQVGGMWSPQISRMARYFHTTAPMCDNVPCYSFSDLATLHKLSVTNLSSNDSTSIQELY
jgi:hypothetical protein